MATASDGERETGSGGTIALVMAAGRGTRLGGAAAKPYQAIAGVAMLRRSVMAFLAHPEVHATRVVIHPDDRARHDTTLDGLDLLDPVAGGATRQDSVRLGLESLVETAPGKVLIHDAARPFVAAQTISAVIAALRDHAGAVPAHPLADSLKRVADAMVAETIPRHGLWRTQTPQGFRFRDILAAHRARAGAELTDDAAVAEAEGLAVAVVPAPESNFKVTTMEDMMRARAAAAPSLGDIRVGNGFDVHRFTAGEAVMLCGVAVPHDQGLLGHSDADVALHALTDAILGAIGAGDIGQHFPPSDARWRDAPSDRFLAHARALVAERGGEIAHVDLTLILERPKVGPHREAMRARVAEILGIEPGRVSVKATTTEKLGFLGRREGIAAQATATIRLPG